MSENKKPHCHFCRSDDVCELVGNEIALYLCNQHALVMKELLAIAMMDGNFMKGRVGLK